MAQKCPKCGRDLKWNKEADKFICPFCGIGTRGATETAGFWQNVESGDIKEPTSDVTKKDIPVSKYSRWIKRIIAVILVVFPFILFSWLITAATGILLAYAATIPDYGPQLTAYATTLIWIVIIIPSALAADSLSKKGWGSLLIIILVYYAIFGFVTIVLFGPLGQGFMSDILKKAEFSKCLAEHQNDQEFCEKLLGEKKTPPIEKTTDQYKVLDVKIGIKDRDYAIPEMRKDQLYNIPLYLENVQKSKQEVTDVVVWGYVKGDDCVENPEDVEKNEPVCIKFIASDCSEDKPCTIQTRKSISLKSENPIDYSRRDVDIVVYVKYSYSTNGKNDFYVYKTESDYKAPPKIKGNDGPLNVVVYFMPDYVTAETEDMKSVTTYIDIVNTGKDHLDKQPGVITRAWGDMKTLKLVKLSDFGGEEPSYTYLSEAKCQAPWDVEFGEDEELTVERKIYTDYEFVCNHDLRNPELGDSPFKKTEFSASLDYDYIIELERKWLISYE